MLMLVPYLLVLMMMALKVLLLLLLHHLLLKLLQCFWRLLRRHGGHSWMMRRGCHHARMRHGRTRGKHLWMESGMALVHGMRMLLDHIMSAMGC